jgi:signal transduction histidine kinase
MFRSAGSSRAELAGSVWRRLLPLAFVIVSLFALALVPMMLRQRTNRIRQELTKVVEPARSETEEVSRALAAELTFLVAFQSTEQMHYITRYRASVALEAAAMERLVPQSRALGPRVYGKLAELRAAIAAWHRAVDDAEFTRRGLPAPVFQQRLFESLVHLERSQRAALELEHAIRVESNIRQLEIDAAERLNLSLSSALAVLALVSALTVAWIGRQMRLLAREAGERQQEAKNEAERATEARSIAEDAHQRVAFLADASREIGGSLEMKSILQHLADLTVPFLADFTLVDVTQEDGSLVRAAAAHRNQAKRRFLDELSPQPPYATLPQITAMLESDQPTVIEPLPQDLRMALASNDERLAEMLDPRGAIVAPLIARGRLLGVILLVHAEARRSFGNDDIWLAAELSRRVALAADNARLYEESQQALRSREEILAIVSHDLRSPLTTISVTTSLLQQAPPAPAELQEHLETMRIAARRMTRLINDLLDVSRIDSGHKLPIEAQPIEVAPILEEVIGIFRPQADNRNIRLELSAPPEPVQILADRDRLIQAMSNLIGNAIKFTPDGGTVSLRAEPRASEMEFAVRDTGPGVPEENLARIWDPYWQLKRTARMGAGLGLPIARGIVEAHSGRIWVESRPGKGTTFYFTIPLASASVA